MRIKITRDCAINGEHTPAGETVDLPENSALDLINMGKATPIGKVDKAIDRAIGLTTETAAPLKRRGRKK